MTSCVTGVVNSGGWLEMGGSLSGGGDGVRISVIILFFALW